MLILVFLWGIIFVGFRRSIARRAVRQAEWITGKRFDEGIYVFMFTYGGLLMAVFALLTLLGVVK